ncbi:LppU/SCO3897 family protein [Nocardia sp. NPDC004722]
MWFVVGTAVVLLSVAAALAARAITRQGRARVDPAVPGVGVRARALISGLAVSGWVLMFAAVASNLPFLHHDTIAGSAIAAPPELVRAGQPSTVADKPQAPDPMAALKVGDCVEVPIEQARTASGDPTWRAGTPEPSDCGSVDANYRVLQIGPGPCTDPLYTLESAPHDKSGKVRYHLCLTFDWRAGVCYDTTNMDVPSKVDCATTGEHIVQATAVFANSTSGAGCPRDHRGAVWVVWNKLQLTVCFRGSDNPGK